MDEWMIDRSVEGWTGKYFRSRKTDRQIDGLDRYISGWMDDRENGMDEWKFENK